MLHYTENQVFGKKNVFRLVEFLVVERDSTGLIFPQEQERLSTSEDMSSPLCSSETAYSIPASKHVVEEAQELETQNTQQRQGLRTQNVSSEIIESVQSCMDEEVIGIITMEDVMEELLQVPKLVYVFSCRYTFES